MRPLSLNLLMFAALLICCSYFNTPARAQAQKKISQFDMAGYCDFLIDKSGNYHTVFQERPGIGKPNFIYYSTSSNKGATWSKPVTLSNDGTGNSSGYARILQDGSGRIYAIWKRYGNTTTNDNMTPMLDGPGGYSFGTLFYKVLSGGVWSQQVQLNELQQGQESWFATVAPTGGVYVFWTQEVPDMINKNYMMWYYSDWLRMAQLNGTTPSAYTSLNTPSPLNSIGFPAKTDGAMNLDGCITKTGAVHFIYEETQNDVQKLEYYDGKTQRTVYSYPAYKAGNTFFNPPHLLVDENGNDHVVFVPCAAALESEQIWDINLTTNKTEILASIQKPGIMIKGFQANQGPNGAMAVSMEIGSISSDAEAFGMYYANGTWKDVGLTNNAVKSKFFSKDFIGVGGYLSNVSVLTSYRSVYASVAYDAAGRKSLLMTIAGHTVGNGGYGIDNPFITYMPVDH